MGRCPAILIGGVSSGVGKTSLTLGIVRALVRRGLRVQTFKVGPDFLDPSYLKLASGRPCYNLDGWMTGRDYVEQLFARVTADADIAIIEGVMGLFDGASPTSLEGSSAEIAMWLDAPVLLVANAHGAARSLAAVVMGFTRFEPGLRMAGVIANHAGSDRHRKWLGESLAAAGLPPLVGAVPRDSLPTLQSRHLGLMTADSRTLPDQTINQLADACEKHVDIDTLLAAAGAGKMRNAECGMRNGASSVQARPNSADRQADPHDHSGADVGLPFSVVDTSATTQKGKPAPAARARIAVARDEAFHFYYPDNIEILESFGAELVEFSPLRDARLPADVGGVYLGGGYPEVHAAALAANVSMLADIRRHAADGKAIYVECGGLMYLGQTITALDGTRSALAGVLPIETAMLAKLKSLGYVQAAATAESLWSDPADGQAVLRGHEFHYSEIVRDAAAAQGWRPAYAISRRDGRQSPEGYAKGLVLASYVHAHFASCPRAAERFVELCRKPNDA